MAEQESAITAGLSPSETLANKIEWLIQNMWPADAPPAKNNIDTAAAIAAATGEEISSTTVWKLRTGRQDNPQLRTLTALATFFGVPIGYFGFAAEAEPIDDDLTLKALLRELHAGTISPDVLRALVDLPPDVRWVVDEMILAAAAAGRRRRTDAD
ncbi:MAG: family transcriptional regulator [Actinomycetia bacterium]|nr:family transcriptional regulator [Actinomycetes bacterium]